MEYYNNILCISKPEITKGNPNSPNSTDWPIMTSLAYDQYVCRNKHIRLRKGGGHNCPALLSYDLLRQDLKDAIVAKYGNPYKKVIRNHFANVISPDPKALKFYKAYRFDNGRTLPDKNIKEYYTNAIVLNAVQFVLNDSCTLRKALGNGTKNLWNNVSEVVNKLDIGTYPHTLPTNHRRLAQKYRLYLKKGYESLIHSAFCNKNTEKINDIGKMWILARWANQVDRVANERQLLDEYNQQALVEGWKTIKNVGTIHNYLYREDIQGLWWGYRYGELKSKEKFAMQLSTAMPSMRDSLWYSDGTKLNYYYINTDGKVETCQVYEVMDAYSEVMLGYHISKTEDYEAQYHAYKMAFKTSGHKPYQITYDNQGGHKKLETGEFLTRLAHIAIKTQPYNGKSKTIESAFGRFQEQILKKDWFFTGQNITAKRLESRANLEFIMANKANLPTLEEIKIRYKQRRDEWNRALHPKTGIPRMQMYYASVNSNSPKVEIWDMVDLFWITRKEPITCRAYGISFTEKKQSYDYLVYSEPMKPDQEWLRRNIDKKFVVKFDPDDMSLIYLYERDTKGLRFVTQAETKIVVHRGKQEQQEGEAAFIRHIIDENKRLRLKDKEQMETILEQHNQDAASYGLVSPSLKGIETTKNKRKHKKETSYAQVEKELSNTVEMKKGNEDSENIDYYTLY